MLSNFKATIAFCCQITIGPFWRSSKLVRCQFATFVFEHLDRQASSESAFERIGNAFGSTGVERERISTLLKRIWIDRRRARSYFSTPEMHLGRQASSGSAFECIRKAFGSPGVERERMSRFQKCIWVDKRRSRALLRASGTLFVLIWSTKRRALFARQNKYFLRFADSRRCCLRRSDGASPARSNSISLDKNSTSSARAIHEKRLALHT